MSFQLLFNRKDKPLPIGFVEKFSYGLGDFASCMLYVATQAFLMFYYTEYVGVNIGMVAAIMLASRVFDGFSDIIMGHLIERTESKYGKSRSWILKMLIPYVLGATLLFSVPTNMGDFAKLIYIFFSYNFAITCVYTAINLPYGAMSTMMTQDSYERTIIVIYRMVLAAGGYATITSVTMPLVRFFGNDARAWTYTFLLIGLVGAVMFFITFFFCHERVASPVPAPENRNFRKSIKCVFQNKYWVMLTLAFVFVCTADVTFSSVNIYYCKYFLNDDGLIGPFGLISTVGRIGTMIFVLPLALRPFGKRNCLIIACFVLLFAISLRLVMPYSVNAFYVSSLLWGIGHGFTYSTLFAMIPDTVEYGEYKDGERHEGYIYAGASFGTKIAGGLGPVIMGVILDFGGYIPNAAAQTDAANNAILMTCTVVPMAIFVLAIVAMIGYHLDREYPLILEKLALRKKNKQEQNESSVGEEELSPKGDPISGEVYLN